MEVHQGEAIRLNIGGGKKVYPGWRIVDLRDDADIVADVRKIPVPDHYADEAMAIHVLEHIVRWDAIDTLKEWRRVLKPGGLMAVEVPDFLKCCQIALNGDIYQAQRGMFGDETSRVDCMTHRWSWHPAELIEAMKEAGFRKVRLTEAKFHRKARDMRVEGLA